MVDGPHHRGPIAIVSIAVAALLAIVGLLLASRLGQHAGSTDEARPAVSSSSRVTSAMASSAESSTVQPTVTSAPAGANKPVDATATNPLTSAIPLAHKTCPLPKWSSLEAAERVFLDGALGCLNAAWQPVLAKLNLPFEPARLVLTPEVGSQHCGRPPEKNSFYCDGTIYLVPSSYTSTNAGPQGVPAAAVGMLAHEYGHHLQQLSGTLAASTHLIDAAGRTTPTGLELARRTELQAQCLSGMFISAAFDVGSVALAERDNYSRGDAPGADPVHGRPEHFGAWFTRGAQRNSLDACNTWVAESDAVG